MRLDWRLWIWLLVSGLGVACAGVARAQVVPDASVGAALRSLASRASDVFVGQVVSVTRKGGVVEVGFRVDQSVAGVQGGSFVLREWAGLWPPGMQRYVLGQRVMVFLHAASGAGLSSPVDGAEGVVPVVVESAAAAPLLDVRRLAARVQRGTTEALADVETATVALSDATKLVKTWREPVWKEPRRLPLPGPFRPAPLPPGRGRLVSVEPVGVPVVGPMVRVPAKDLVGAGVVLGGFDGLR